MLANIVFISGGPGTGKTAVINSLSKRGYEILPEAAREIAEEKFSGKSIIEIDRKFFQDEIFRLQKILFDDSVRRGGIFFSDRGFGDTIAYYKINHLGAPKNVFEYAKKFNYARVFILEPLNFYKNDLLRQESKEEQEKIQAEIVRAYKELGNGIVGVPFMSVEKRTEFVLKNSGVPNL